MTLIEELLGELYNRQKERREEALNVIALLFTILSVIEIIVIFVELFGPGLTPLSIALIVLAGTTIIGTAILFYLRFSGRRNDK